MCVKFTLALLIFYIFVLDFVILVHNFLNISPKDFKSKELLYGAF